MQLSKGKAKKAVTLGKDGPLTADQVSLSKLHFHLRASLSVVCILTTGFGERG